MVDENELINKDETIPREEADGIHYYDPEDQSVEYEEFFEPFDSDMEEETEDDEPIEEEEEDDENIEGEEDEKESQTEEENTEVDDSEDDNEDSKTSADEEIKDDDKQNAKDDLEEELKEELEKEVKKAVEKEVEEVGEKVVVEGIVDGFVALSPWSWIVLAVFIILLLLGGILLMSTAGDFIPDSTGASATSFSCEGKEYVFPYVNKDVPSIPKTHHDYSAIDLMSADGQPLVAVTSGTVRNPHSSDSGLGGIGLTIIGDDGYYYYYAHLEYLTPGLTSGSRIEAGDPVGRSGHTGNASASSPHLHFGISKGEQVKGFYPSKVTGPGPAQESPWKTLEAWKRGECITPGT